MDADTFSVSKAGVEITNAVSDGDYSMDINTFIPGTATYLSRSDWDGTFPTTITQAVEQKIPLTIIRWSF